MRTPTALLLLLVMVGCAEAPWQPAELRLHTRWSGEVTPANARPEYPRPELRREDWLSLNGLWRYAIVARDSTPTEMPGRILVPFPIESPLSGVADTVGAERRLWYSRQFELPRAWSGRRVALNFEAVDWEAQVWVNGREVGRHAGGYDPFSFDITEALAGGDEQEIVVAVWDPTDGGTQPRGKQVRKPGGIFYTSVTGIWGSVWLEPLPEAAIRDYYVVSDIDQGRATINVEVDRAEAGDELEIAVSANGAAVAAQRAPVGQPVVVAIANPRLWSPEDPHLYEFEIRLLRSGAPLDRVTGYFGMRKIAVGRDESGTVRLLLNNRFVFQSGTLDQGYWPDGLYTAPTEQAMVYDLEMTRAMGFNMLRKHVKVEPRSFYHWCDRLGLLVWQDMPSASIPLEAPDSDTPTDTAATAQFEAELVRIIRALRNHPSIVIWVPFNEGWGQYHTGRIVELVRATDPTRLVNQASGWYERGFGDLVDGHSYPAPEPPAPEARRAAVQGEFGGLGFNAAGHMWTEEGWGYALYSDRESLAQRFEDLFLAIRAAAQQSGLSASVYTQTTDIETENNGLLTYDREVAKIEPEAVALAQRGYPAPRAVRAAPIFLDSAVVELHSQRPSAAIRYTTDGTEPTTASALYTAPFSITATTQLRARAWWEDGTVSRASSFTYEKRAPEPAADVASPAPGLSVEYYETEERWSRLPDFGALVPAAVTTSGRVRHALGQRDEYFGLRFRGYLRVPQTGVYAFHLTSDDGSRLYIGGTQIVDNDGIHGATEKSGYAALEAGLHAIELVFFQRAGGVSLELSFEGPGLPRQEIPAELLLHD
jgi:hypothetical protein